MLHNVNLALSDLCAKSAILGSVLLMFQNKMVWLLARRSNVTLNNHLKRTKLSLSEGKRDFLSQWHVNYK